jgi:hypothetical protein
MAVDWNKVYTFCRTVKDLNGKFTGYDLTLALDVWVGRLILHAERYGIADQVVAALKGSSCYSASSIDIQFSWALLSVLCPCAGTPAMEEYSLYSCPWDADDLRAPVDEVMRAYRARFGGRAADFCQLWKDYEAAPDLAWYFALPPPPPPRIPSIVRGSNSAAQRMLASGELEIMSEDEDEESAAGE